MSDYRTKAVAQVEVNGNAANELERLKKRAEDLKDALAEAWKTGDAAAQKKLDKALKETNRQIRTIQNEMVNVEQTLKRLDKATPKELRQTLSRLEKDLKNIERGSKAWDEQTKKIKAVRTELAKIKAETKEQESLWNRFAKKMFDWGAAIQVVMASVTGITMTARKAVEAFAGMDQEMASVRKYTGMTADEVERLNEEFKKMDTRSSREQLNKLAQEAGRLGMQSQEDIMGFVRAADKINVALDELGDGATITLSKLTDIFGDRERLGVEQSLLSVGSVINELSQNCTASAPYLAEFASRMGGVGAQAGMTIQQIMAFGAVLDSNNQKVEASATALSQVLVRLYQDPAKYAKVAGLDIKQFSDLLKQDANAALIQLLESLQKVGGMDVLSPMFKDMGENGARAIQALSTLATHIEDVKSQQDVANQAFEEAISIDKEFDVQNNTVQAGLEKAKKSFNEMAVSLGEKLAPVMRYAITSSSALMKVMAAVIDFVVQYKYSIGAATAAVVTYYTVMNLATVKTKLLAAATAFANTWEATYIATMRLGNIVIALYNKNTTRAAAATKLFAASLRTTPVGLLVAGIGLAVTAFVAYREKVKNAREEQERLKSSAKNTTDAIRDVTAKIGEETSVVKRLTDAINAQNIGSGKRNALIREFNNKFGSYLTNLLNEKSTAQDVASAYAEVVRHLRAKLLLEAKEKDLKETVGVRYGWEAQNLADFDKIAKGNGIPVTGSWLKAATDEAFAAGSRDAKSLQQAVFGAYVTTLRKAGLNDAGTGSNAKDNELQLAMGAYIRQYISTRFHEELVNKKWAPYESDIDAIIGSAMDYGGEEGYTPSGGSGSNGNNNAEPDKFKAEKEWREYEEALNRIAYATGQKNYEDYTKRMLKIEEQFYKEQLKHADLTKNERIVIGAQLAEVQRKQVETTNKFTIEEENKAYAERKATTQQMYLDGLLTAEQYNKQMELSELQHLKNIRDIYKGQAETAIKEWEEARQKAAEQMQSLYKGNVDLLNRPVIDAHELTKAGWSGNPTQPGEATATVYSSQYGIKDASGAVREILVTPILPDGSVLSEKELEDYIRTRLEGAENILAADDKGIVIAVDVSTDGKAGEDLHKLQEAFYSLKPNVDEKAWENYLKANATYREKLVADQVKNHQEYEQKEKEHQKKLADAWEEYAYDQKEKQQKVIEETKKLIEAAYKAKLAELEMDESLTPEDRSKKIAELTSRYQKAIQRLTESIKGDKGEKSLGEWMGNLLDKMFGEGTWDKYGDLVKNMASSVMSVWSNINQLWEAEEQQRLADLEKRYDREISMAEGNAYKIKEIERKKQKEEAKLKAEASKKQFAQQVISAIAQTATAALNAYATAPAPTMIWGPIAAAMATAAGLVQIAAIKKQQSISAAQGYAEGGFTPDGPKDKPVGIVHAGEWVASQKLLRNPITRPAIEALDYAQKNNTFGSIRQEDVTRHVTAPVVIAQASSDGSMERAIVAMSVVMRQYQETMQRLGNRLDEPFVTIATVSGDKGIKQAQDEYQRLQNNSLPKAKRK